MDSAARSMISSSAVPFHAAGDGGGQVFLFGGGGGGGFLRGAPLVGGAAGAGAADGRRKRPFQLTAHEELQLQLQLELGDDELCGLDYELHGPQSQQERTKRRLTAEQVRELELSFEEEKRKLEPERKSELARRLGIAPRQVAVWFQNRRARWRTKQLEQDFDRLRAAHDDLLAGRDALLADNDRLRSQVIMLTEKLQAKESSASEAEEQTVAVQATAYARFQEDRLCSEIATGSTAALAPGTNDNDSPAESYFAGARSPPSSPEDDDCGCGANDDRTFFLPDALLAAAEEDGDGAHLNNWAWLWNDQQY